MKALAAPLRPTREPTDRAPSWTEPPGGILVWLIVLVELATFGMGLVVFLTQAHEHSKVFRLGRATLDQRIALLNTSVLLTGGWFMTIALDRLRQGRRAPAARWLLATAGSGMLFLLLKGWEYADKLRHGLDLHADVFFTTYWLLTGFHFLHVLVAVVLLLAMWWMVASGRTGTETEGNVESCGVFWHMCDLIWLLVYPVIYLLR